MKIHAAIAIVALLAPVLGAAAPPAPPGPPAPRPVLVGQFGGQASTVVLAGAYAYMNAGPRLLIVDVSDPAHPQLAGQSRDLPKPIAGLAVAGRYAYVADLENGLVVFDVLDPARPVQLGTYPPVGLSWSQDVAVAAPYLYVSDTNSGLRVFDIGDPARPVQIGFLSYGGIYKFEAAGDYVYAVDDYALQTIDVSDPAHPHFAGLWGTSDYMYDIAVAGNRAYLANANLGLRIVDVSDPAQPQLLGTYGTSLMHMAGVILSGTLAFASDSVVPAGGLRIVDVSDPAQPALVGLWDSPGSPAQTALAGAYAYLTDGAAGLHVLDVSDPAQPTEAGAFPTLGEVRGAAVAGPYAYVAGGVSGLRVLDVSQPGRIVPLGARDTPGSAYGVSPCAPGMPANHIVCVADFDRGLRVIDAGNPADPVEVGAYDTPGLALAVVAQGRYAYLADYQSGLRIVDVYTPTQPAPVGLYANLGVYDVAVAGSYAYVTTQNSIRVVDVSDPANPVETGAFTPGYGSMFGLDVQGSYVYATFYDSYLVPALLLAIDVTDPANPALASFAELPIGVPFDVTAAGAYAYVVDDSYTTGLQVVDISAPGFPQLVSVAATLSGAQRVTVVDHTLYVSNGAGGLMLFWWRPPGTMLLPAVRR